MRLPCLLWFEFLHYQPRPLSIKPGVGSIPLKNVSEVVIGTQHMVVRCKLEYWGSQFTSPSHTSDGNLGPEPLSSLLRTRNMYSQFPDSIGQSCLGVGSRL